MTGRRMTPAGAASGADCRTAPPRGTATRTRGPHQLAAAGSLRPLRAFQGVRAPGGVIVTCATVSVRP